MAGTPDSFTQRFAAWPFAAHLAVAAWAGAMAALGQAPADLPVFTVLGLALGVWLWRMQPTRRTAGWVGWALGTGYFLVALHWIVEPFQVDAARHGWMAPFALVFLSGGLALFWAGAFWVARAVSPRAFALVLTLTGAEVLRAYIFTGFPWASPAQVLVNGPASMLLALGGPHGAMLLLMALAWVLSLPAACDTRRAMGAGKLMILLAAAFALHMPLVRSDAALTGKTVRLIQPNAAQHLKWQPDYAMTFFNRQLALTAEASDAQPDLVIWPETAIPWRLDSAETALRTISGAAGGTPVALGALRTAEDGVRNALAVLDGQGAVAQVYDKHHLVPFGEYIPMAQLAGRLGLTGLAAAGMGFSAGDGPQMLDFGALGRALPLICYEAVFAHGVGRAPERPDFLLQITNDAWFGDFAGPQQHLAQARMRAIEQGLPLVRAANTGISAVIDPYGRVTAFLPLGVDGFIDAALPRANNPTLYARIGDVPVIVLLLFGLAMQLIAARRRGTSD